MAAVWVMLWESQMGHCSGHRLVLHLENVLVLHLENVLELNLGRGLATMKETQMDCL